MGVEAAPEIVSDGAGLRVALACARFNGSVTQRLLDCALLGLQDCGVDRGDLSVTWVPGAFELPLAALALARSGADAVVCLGAVIRGETAHFDLVARSCASGIARVQLDTGVPVAFGVLATDTLDQALARATPGPLDAGRHAATTAVDMALTLRALRVEPQGS